MHDDASSYVKKMSCRLAISSSDLLIYRFKGVEDHSPSDLPGFLARVVCVRSIDENESLVPMILHFLIVEQEAKISV